MLQYRCYSVLNNFHINYVKVTSVANYMQTRRRSRLPKEMMPKVPNFSHQP